MLPVVTGTDVVVVTLPSTRNVVFVPIGAIHARQMALVRTPLWAPQDTVVEVHRRLVMRRFALVAAAILFSSVVPITAAAAAPTASDPVTARVDGHTYAFARPGGLWRDSATGPTRLRCRKALRRHDSRPLELPLLRSRC